ncbi:ABC-F type ribosomal protection protein [Hydrogenispora sp. UU3]|uniref:ABC-F type ribosomal protection protein n=1 Tax=Capillibacterium thermochitinicola TaxID=2699427 RepID=A0A8J6LRZ5_9FIRM|nr:ABC-F type ribosomal protection protein [Capillibacterium thermochitinicola]
MLLLECGKIKKYFGDRLVLDLESLQIYADDRIGVVGPNGAGKTTLLNILSQRLEPDEGWVKLYTRCTYVSQLEPPEQKKIRPELASKFGVPTVWHETMSGGEKTRFKLAAGFAADCPLLFADEPTSNLDLEGIELLEKRLAEYQGALVLVAHDRSLLDRLCNKILEVEYGKVKLYNGNYSAYRQQKEEEKARAQFEYEQYISEKKRLERAAIERRQKARALKKTPKRMGNSEARLHKMGNQKAKAALERAVKSIEARIERLPVKEKPRKQEVIKLDMPSVKQIHSKVLVEGHNLNKSFGEKIIFQDAEFIITNGTKVALLGPNGCGKTTLLKMIVNREAGIRIAPEAAIGYFSQEMDILDEERTILENVMADSIYGETFARTLLSRLLFKRDDVFKRVAVLSGGERVKVSFAKIILKDLNLLILDEPTNYLDLNSLEVVEEVLREYDQTLLLVSHDRRLISAVADQIMTIENGKIKTFHGTYEEFLAREKVALKQEGEEVKKQIAVLENRLSAIIGRLAMPAKNDDLGALDQEYHAVLAELKKLKARMEN